MEVSVLQENLDKVLGFARPFSPKNSNLIMCRMVKLTAKNGALTVEANDMEKNLTATVGAQVHKDGSVCVDTAKFKSFVGTLGEERVELSVKSNESGDPVLSIQSGDNTDATMVCYKPDDFPPLADLPKQVVRAEIVPEELLKAISRVIIASSPEDTRPILSGALFEVGPKGYTMAAADGFRLAVQKGRLADYPKRKARIVVPRDTLSAIRNLVKGSEDTVTVEIQNGKMVKFTVPGATIVSSGILGEFPNYMQLIPPKKDIVWSVETNSERLMNAVRSAEVYARESTNVIRFWVEHPKGTEVVPEEVPAEAPAEAPADVGEASVPEADVGEAVAAATEEAPVEEAVSRAVVRVSASSESTGDAQREAGAYASYGLEEKDAGRIAFNAKYIKDLLGVSEDSIRLEGINPSSPCVFRFVEDKDYVQVVMPIFVLWD